MSGARAGAANHQWKGGRQRTSHGYILLWTEEGYKYEHVIKAESALGKPLPSNAKVHHVDGDGRNNSNTNLVICENQDYHKLIHIRTRVLRAGGDPDMDKMCCMCQRPQPLDNFHRNKSEYDGRNAMCKSCRKEYPR